MIRNNYLLLFICCQFFNYGCSQEKKNDIGQTKARLEEYIEKSENMIDLVQVEFNIKPVQVNSNKAFDENDEYNFTDQQTKYLSTDDFLSVVNKDFFLTTEVGKPKSFVSISLNLLEANEFLGFGENVEEGYSVAPQFKPGILHFWDGTSADANYKADKNAEELAYNHFLVDASKPIRSVDFDVEFKHYTSTSYRLDTSHPKVKIGEDWIEMKSNADGEVKLSYPKSLSEKLSDVQGYYKNNRALRRSGRSSYSISSAETVAWLKKTLPVYKEAIALIDQQKLKTDQEVDSFLKSKLPEKPAEDAQIEFSKYYFAGPVNYVLVYVKNDKPLNVTKKVNVKLLKEIETIGKEGYFTAVDGAEELKGIVDVKGNWIINPVYDDIRAMGEEKFSVREGRIGTPKKLDAKNKKFIDLLP